MVVRRRWWIIIGAILVSLLFASGARFLTLNNDTRVFFSEENPQLRALEALENTAEFFPTRPRTTFTTARGMMNSCESNRHSIFDDK